MGASHTKACRACHALPQGWSNRQRFLVGATKSRRFFTSVTFIRVRQHCERPVVVSVSLSPTPHPIPAPQVDQVWWCSLSEAANHLVEEFMLLANMQVAQKMCTWLPAQSMVRRHGGPLAKKIGPAQEILEQYGFKINTQSGMPV